MALWASKMSKSASGYFCSFVDDDDDDDDDGDAGAAAVLGLRPLSASMARRSSQSFATFVFTPWFASFLLPATVNSSFPSQNNFTASQSSSSWYFLNSMVKSAVSMSCLVCFDCRL